MNKTKVYEVYEKIIHWFDEHRYKGLMEKEYLDLIVNSILQSGSILDLGCGTGEPIAQFFIEKGFKITGIDGSKKMIELCKERFPNETWIVADMREINLQQRFDAIIAWHSFFHLQHNDQRNMFKIFASHIKPGGVLAFTSGTEHDEMKSGATMVESNCIMLLCQQRNTQLSLKQHHLKFYYTGKTILTAVMQQYGSRNLLVTDDYDAKLVK